MNCQIITKKIIGHTVIPTTITYLQKKSILVYNNGLLIIFYRPSIDLQLAAIVHPNDITSLTHNLNENQLAVADKKKNPIITLYLIDLIPHNNSLHWKPTVLYQMKGHRLEIDHMVYSPNGKYLVSISNGDGSLCVWSKGQMLSKNKINKLVLKVIFDHHCDMVTIGKGYLKIWQFGDDQGIFKQQQNGHSIIEGKAITFGKKFSGKQFRDIKLYRQNKDDNKIILLSKDGYLCIIEGNYQRVEKWINVAIEEVYSLQIHDNLAICGGIGSTIKVIDLNKLVLQMKYPKIPPINKQNITTEQIIQYNQDQQFPSCYLIKWIGEYILALYQNKSMFLWQMNENINVVRSFITHQNSIVSIDILDYIKNHIIIFATAGLDCTVRIWYYYDDSNINNPIDVAQHLGIKRNIYCLNLIQIIYLNLQKPIKSIKNYQIVTNNL